jgi:hypothetical protein
MREGLDLARRVGDQGAVLRFSNNAGFTSFESGQWDEGLRLLEGPLSEDLSWIHRTALLSNALVIRAARGESIEPQLAELRGLLPEDADAANLAVPLDPEAWMALARGDLDGARDAWQRMMDLVGSSIPYASSAAARAALWLRDGASAESLLARLDAMGVHGAVVETRRETIKAGLAALAGEMDESAAAFTSAVKHWRDLGLDWYAALTATDAAILIGPARPEVITLAAWAGALMDRVGALPFRARLDEAMGHAGSVDAPGTGLELRPADAVATT